MVTNKEIQPDKYIGKLTLTTPQDSNDVEYERVIDTKERSYDGTCADQNEIVCISFIVSDFNGKILKRIALVRSAYETNENADVVIVTHSEKELLE